MLKTGWMLVIGALFGLVACSAQGDALQMPDTAKTAGAGSVLIPLTATRVDAASVSQYWQLRAVGEDRWEVVILDRGRVISPFSAGGAVLRTSQGTRYAAEGSVTLNGYRYRARYLFINSDNFSGYILLDPVTSAAWRSTDGTQWTGSWEGR